MVCEVLFFSIEDGVDGDGDGWESGKKITNKPHWIALHVDDISPPSLHHPYSLSLRFRIEKAFPGHGLYTLSLYIS